MARIKYLQIKPTPRQVYREKTWTGRKRPYILITFEDGSTRSITIKHVDLRTNPKLAFAAAEHKLQLIQKDAVLGSLDLAEHIPDINSVTVEKLFEEFLSRKDKDVDRNQRAQSTFESDIAFRSVFLSVFNSRTKISEIKESKAQYYIDRLLDLENRYGKKYESSSINTFIRRISAIFTFAVSRGYIDKNPFFGVKSLHVKRTPRFLDDREIEILRKEFSSEKWKKDLFDFGVSTGLRISEILSANIENLRAETVGGKETLFLVVTGKGRGGGKTRFVPVEEARDLIEERVEFLKDKKRLSDYLGGMRTIIAKKQYQRALEGYLFFELVNKELSQNAFLKARHKRGLKDGISPHSMRHTFAVKFLENNRGDIYQLCKILGHESVTTTEIYLSCTPKLLSLRNKI